MANPTRKELNFGDYAWLDWMGLRMADLVAAAFGIALVGTVVLEATFCRFGGHIGAFEHPAVIGEMRAIPGVGIADVSPVHENQIAAAIFHITDLVRAKFSSRKEDGEWQFSARKYREQPLSGRLGATLNTIDSGSYWLALGNNGMVRFWTIKVRNFDLLRSLSQPWWGY